MTLRGIVGVYQRFEECIAPIFIVEKREISKYTEKRVPAILSRSGFESDISVLERPNVVYAYEAAATVNRVKMEAKCSSEASVSVYKTTQCHNQNTTANICTTVRTLNLKTENIILSRNS
jgi:uncharacterized protein YgiM (DUF1202 family)